jgi:hypothetical protein
LNNYQTLLTSAAGGAVVVTPTTLQTAGTLDPAFVDTNYWGQNHVTLVRLVAAGQQQAMSVTCGGDAIPDGTLVRLALNIPYDGASILSTAPTLASAGQKQATVAPFANATCPVTAGHIAALTYFDNSQIVPPWLNRFAVPGASPATEPNTMHTVQYMGGNNIQDVGDVVELNRVNPDNSAGKLSQAPFLSVTTDTGHVPKMTGCPGNATPNVLAWPAGMIVASGTPDNGFWASVTDGGTFWIANLNSYSQPASGGSGPTAPKSVGITNSLIIVSQGCP